MRSNNDTPFEKFASTQELNAMLSKILRVYQRTSVKQMRFLGTALACPGHGTYLILTAPSGLAVFIEISGTCYAQEQLNEIERRLDTEHIIRLITWTQDKLQQGRQ